MDLLVYGICNPSIGSKHSSVPPESINQNPRYATSKFEKFEKSQFSNRQFSKFARAPPRAMARTKIFLIIPLPYINYPKKLPDHIPTTEISTIDFEKKASKKSPIFSPRDAQMAYVRALQVPARTKFYAKLYFIYGVPSPVNIIAQLQIGKKLLRWVTLCPTLPPTFKNPFHDFQFNVGNLLLMF